MPDEPAQPTERPKSVEALRTVTEDTAQRLIRTLETSRPIRQLRGSQVATAFVATIGFALVVVGIERAAQDIPIVENEWGSIAVGLIFLAASGLLVRRMLGQ